MCYKYIQTALWHLFCSVLISLSILPLSGHLMGKKSTDNLIESQERDRDMGQFVASPTGGRELDRTLGPSSPFWVLFRTLLAPEQDEVPVSQTLKQVQNILEERRRTVEQRELHRHLKEVGDESEIWGQGDLRERLETHSAI